MQRFYILFDVKWKKRKCIGELFCVRHKPIRCSRFDLSSVPLGAVVTVVTRHGYELASEDELTPKFHSPSIGLLNLNLPNCYRSWHLLTLTILGLLPHHYLSSASYSQWCFCCRGAVTVNATKVHHSSWSEAPFSGWSTRLRYQWCPNYGTRVISAPYVFLSSPSKHSAY